MALAAILFLGLLGAWVLAPLALGIPLAYLTLRQRIRHSIRPCDASEIPRKWVGYLTGNAEYLISKGFQQIAWYRHGEMSNSAELAYVGHLCNPTEGIQAYLYLLVSKYSHMRYAQFTTRFNDGTVLVTYNAQIPSAFVYPDHMLMRRVEQDDVGDLLENHRIAFREEGENKRVQEDWEPDYISESHRINEEVLLYQQEKGLMQTDENGAIFRPTIQGATKMILIQWLRMRFRLTAPKPLAH